MLHEGFVLSAKILISLLSTKYLGQNHQFKSAKDFDAQKELFLNIRYQFNLQKLTDVEEAAYMIFLNRTCFNGLYRENTKGYFNVPFGRYTNPTICDKDLLTADSELLQKVEILNGDYSQVGEFVDGYTFIYFDPPYRPLDATSNFNSYVKEAFDDKEQRRLKQFFSDMASIGCHELLSNSDCKSRNPEDDFFDALYKDFIIERVYAKRNINANGAKRGVLTELLIRNYQKKQCDYWKLFND